MAASEETKTSLQSAIELKRAIDKIPSIIPSLGTCENYCDSDIEDEYREKLEDEKYERSPEVLTEEQLGFEITDNINGYFSGSPQYFTGSLKPELLSAKIGLKKNNITRLTSLSQFTEEKIKNLYNKADPAPYGDLEKIETIYDENVRKAREISNDKFSVDNLIIDEIGKIWKIYFGEIPDKIVSYKINIYGPGDKFNVHRDTPDKDLVGTFLIGLGDTTSNGGLEIIDSPEDDLDDESNCHFMGKATSGKWFTFRPSEYHRVKEIEGGYRVTMSFKIYSSSRMIRPCMNHDICVSIMPFLSELFNRERNCGFILSHEYCLEGSELVGPDALLYDAIQHYRSEFKYIEIIPIIMDYDRTSCGGDWGDGEDIEIINNIYPLTEEAISHVLDKSKPIPSKREDLCFINIGGLPFKWQHSYSRGGYTGNEAEPDQVNAIYLHRAILLFRD